MKRTIAILLALFTLTGGLVFAQNKGALTVQCNVTGAQVYINGKLAGYTTPNFSQLLAAGVYQIRVTKQGYPDFSTTVTMAGQPVIINATLGAPVVVPPPQVIQHALSVSANIQGADVYINGNPAGKTPFSSQIPAGSYTVLVRAPGYLDYSQSIVVNGPVQVTANLQPLSAPLSVSANVQGADVYVNGSLAGKVPYSAQLPYGSYTIVVRAPGYTDFSQSLALSGPAQVNASLQPLMASWQLSVPDAYVNKDLKGGHFSQIMIYVDGAQQRQSSGQILPGRHVIRVTAGGMAVEAVIEAQAGKTYLIEPFMGLGIK